MNILEDLRECQNILYKLYNADHSCSLVLLNEFCAKLSKCCNKLHKTLIFDCQGKYDFAETVFLCLNQIICCIRYLEKTIKIEKNSGLTLFLTKQFFVDRILWCFAKIKSLINSINDDCTFCPVLEEANFVNLLDAALEYLIPYSSYDKEQLNESVPKVDGIEKKKLNCEKLRTSIDKVISQSLAFANVSEANDKKVINSLCQKVLRDCIDFQNELSNKVVENQCGTDNNIYLKAVMVENALYKLEDFINESLLRLIFHVFIDLDNNSIENIRDIVKCNPNDDRISNMISNFDTNVDRLIQIGMLAVTFAPNSQVKTNVRNSLASLESLDSHLVPSLYGKCDLHFALLEEHFIEEVKKLKNCLQTIVETDAFIESFFNILSDSLNHSFNLKEFSVIIQKANLLIQHIKLNESELNLKEKNINEKYNKFVLMVNECQAILTCAEQVDSNRILKRFKIMRSCLKKFRIDLNKNANTTNHKESVFITSEELVESQKMFESLGISPTINKVLYQSKRNRKNLTKSLIAQCSRHISFNNTKRETLQKTPEAKKIKRRASLRTSMFKRHQNEETERIHKIYSENSMNLGLTDILDQLTNLSSSFESIKE